MRRTRYAGPDTLRGLTLVSMMFYHACWDLAYIFGMDWGWYASFGSYLWQQSICWTFILLSGYCVQMGRHRLRRGLLAFGGGALVSAVTFLTMPEDLVFWGVLSLLGAAVLLTIPLDSLLRRIPARAGLAGSFLLFLLLRDVDRGCLGFPPADFFSTDYFPLLPWFFLFLTGYFLYRLRPEGEPSNLRLPVVTALGRHSLVVYLLHQPVIYGLLWLLFSI